MTERTRAFLLKAERMLRPRSSAIRLQAHEMAALTGEFRRGIEALYAATDAVVTAAATISSLAPRDPAAAAPTDADTADAAAAAVDERNPNYDRWTGEIIRKVMGPADTAVDVGAHAGSVLEAIIAAAPHGKHHAFEPLSHMAERLRERFPGVHVHELALAEEPGESTFHHVVSNPSYSGLRRRRFDRPFEAVVETTVQVARLDDVVGPDQPVKLIKIDVEGGELGVLRGGIETIRAHRPYVVFEHGLGGTDFYGTRPEEVFDLLTEAGLHLNLLDRFLAGDAPIDRAEFVRQYETTENYYFIAHPH